MRFLCLQSQALAICVTLLLVGCATSQEPAERWQVLFDGSNLNAWQALGQSDMPAGHWVIEGDSLHKVGSNGGAPHYGGDLRTVERYTNFELCFDFKLGDAANSGVKYNVSEEMSAQHGAPTAAIGFEYQVLDDQRHPDAKQGKDGNRTLGSLYDVYPASVVKPEVVSGRWHNGCVLADGDTISHYLEDEVVLTYNVRSDDFIARVAASKFKAVAGFAERRPGYIALQDHFDDVWYRNIRIRRLSASK